MTAASDRVRPLARIPRGRTTTVERRTGDEAWASPFGVSEEGVVEDRSVETGARYGYRLVDLASRLEGT